MNNELISKFADVSIKVPEIFLPKDNFEKFSVIAVDQFVENKKYWDDVKEYVGDAVSSLNLVFPEAYMPFDDAMIKTINNNMKKYIDDKKLISIGECMVYVERMTTTGIRKGLIAQIDLENYDYNIGSKTPIRATEKTVKERLPIRVKIRENATLDLPHIMLLINDKKNILFDTITSYKNELEKLYDFNLMFGGGNISGFKIADEMILQNIASAITTLKNDANDNLLYAVGDGNHSLAAAKQCYEKTKKNRYALVEIVNLYDTALAFYPIHRLLQNIDKNNVLRELDIDINNLPALNVLQDKIDNYLLKHKYAKLEYIHGKNVAEELGKKDGNVAFIYDKFDKETLFDTVIKYGSLCRKSFSMGENIDKRYYLESVLLADSC